MITVANDLVADHVPDLTATDAFAGLCRTVHSLSLRSRVIVGYGDFAALPAVAAGADTVGQWLGPRAADLRPLVLPRRLGPRDQDPCLVCDPRWAELSAAP